MTGEHVTIMNNKAFGNMGNYEMRTPLCDVQPQQPKLSPERLRMLEGIPEAEGPAELNFALEQ